MMSFDEYYEKLITANFRPDSIDKELFFVMGSEEYLSNMVYQRGVILDESPFIIPEDSLNKRQLLGIDRKTKMDVEHMFGIISELDWQCNTVANTVFENILRRLFIIMHNMQCSSLDLNFYDLFSICLSTKRNKNAEKEGNINIFFRSNEIFNSLISPTKITNDSPRSIFDFKFSKYSPLFKQIDSASQVELTNKFGIVISDTWVCTAITYTFLKNICDSIISDTRNDHKTSFLNFNDIIEFHAIADRGNIVGAMRPGMNAKLIVKSDELTELDNDGDLY